jgi:hypothetical protein
MTNTLAPVQPDFSTENRIAKMPCEHSVACDAQVVHLEF